MSITINTKLVKYTGTAPEKGRPTDAAYDLRAAMDAIIYPGERKLIYTGFSMAVPRGHAGLVLSRSGLALKHGVIVLNAPGLIDPDYIGDVGVILLNTGDERYPVSKGDRIAQVLFVETGDVELTKVRALGITERGDEGFGSSGVA